MPVTGITNLYTSFATDVIKSHVENNTIHAVSRASIERELIAQLDRASDLNVDYKIAWYHAILETPLFDSLWYSLSIRHSLPAHTTERYTVKASLYEYEVLTSASTKPSSSKPSTSKPAATKKGPSTSSKAGRKPNKAMRYVPSSPAVSGSPHPSRQFPHDSEPFADASNPSSSSSSASSSSSSSSDEDEVDEEAAALGRSLYAHAIATTTTTASPPPPTSKVIGGAGRIGVGVKTRTPAAPSSTNPKKPKIAEKVEEPGDGEYRAASAAANSRRGGGARKGIDRKAGAKGKGKQGSQGKKGVKLDKLKEGKVVKFVGLDEVGEGKENHGEVEKGGKRQRVPTEKVMLAKQ